MNPGQFEILKPFIDDRINALVRGRLLEGLKFFERGMLRPEFTRSEVKLALLLIRIANPKESFIGPEIEVMEGRQRKIPIRSSKPAKRIPAR